MLLESTDYLEHEIGQHCRRFVDQVRLLAPIDRAVILLFVQELDSSRVIFDWRPDEGRLFDLECASTPDNRPEKKLLNLPLYGGEGRIGASLLHFEPATRLARQETQMIYRISEELGIGLENAELNRQMRAEAEETEALESIARIVTSSFEVERVYAFFAAALRVLIDFERLELDLIDPDRGYFVKRFLAGPFNSGPSAGNNCHAADGQIQHLIDTGRTLIRKNIADPIMFPFDQEHLAGGLPSSLAVPISSQDRVIAVLCLRSRRVAAYGRREQSILEQVAERIAPAIENAMLAQRLQAKEEELATSEEIARVVTQMAEQLEVQAGATAEGNGFNPSPARRSDLAHILRSPLTSIKGFASSLLRTDVNWSEAGKGVPGNHRS